MKKYIITLNVFLLLLNAYGEVVPVSQVRTMVSNYMQLQHPSKRFSIRTMRSEGINFMQTVSSPNALLHIINFNEGGWAITSNDYNAPPVLAYGSQGIFDWDTNNMPPACLDLLKGYKDEVNQIKLDGTTTQGGVNPYIKYRQNWLDLLNTSSQGAQNISQAVLNSLDKKTLDLLNDPRRGYKPNWGQDKDNYGSCNLSYNMFHPAKEEFTLGCFGLAKKCNCDRKPAGCGPVAMAQLMRYWRFPPQYAWEEMPTGIYYSTTSRNAKLISSLLLSCGEESGATFCCSGTYTFMDDMLEAFQGYKFPYSFVKKMIRKDVDRYSPSWSQLIKSEIDAGRPIIYRGDRNDFSGDKHIWLVSGYDADGKFYCNWGWRGNYEGYFSLSDLVPNDKNGPYNRNNRILYNLYPNWDGAQNLSLNNVTQEAGSDFRHFGKNISMSNIVLRNDSFGKICATSTITINGSFTVEEGSSFELLHCDELMDAAKLTSSPQYAQKNDSYPKDLSNAEADIQDMETLSMSSSENHQEFPTTKSIFYLYPNPNGGSFQIKMQNTLNDETKTVYIFSLAGRLVWKGHFSGQEYRIHQIPKGIYIVVLRTSTEEYKEKLFIQ